MKLRYFILLIIIATVPALKIQSQDAGIMADSAYNAENYAIAIDLYNRAISEHGPDANTYYNLGNAYYRNGNNGLAVLAYERSLRLDPTDKDARHNLKFVNSHLDDMPEDDSSFLSNLHYGIMGSMKADSWAWTAFGLFIILCGAIALYIFSANIRLRKAGFFGAFVLAFIFVYTVYLAYDSRALATSDKYAIVTVPSTYLNSVPRPPRNSSEPVVSLHEGAKVEITDSVATPDDPQSAVWYNVKINNGTKAWLRGSDVTKI